jgi:hypothetical protein
LKEQVTLHARLPVSIPIAHLLYFFQTLLLDVVFLDEGLNSIITSIKVARQIFHRMKVCNALSRWATCSDEVQGVHHLPYCAVYSFGSISGPFDAHSQRDYPGGSGMASENTCYLQSLI